MANLMDLCEVLAQEGYLAQDYEAFGKKVKDKDGKKIFRELQELSVQKMKILHGLISKAPWVLTVKK